MNHSIYSADRPTHLKIVVVAMVEVEHIEQVADRRHVAWHISVLTVLAILFRIRQVIAAAVAERGIQNPVPFNEFHERGMLVIGVADMAAD